MFVAEKIRALIAATPFATRSGDTRVTASFGVASTGTNGPDIALKVDALIRTADECLYTSKQGGRNRTEGLEIAVSPPLVAARG
jgi:PleD family two-component response regulator